MRITTFIFLFLAISVMIVSIYFAKKRKKKGHISDPSPTEIFPYRVNSPTRSFELPKKLREISDLSFDARTNSLWAIADEKGVLYQIDLPNAENITAFPFGGDGDYEGLELVGDTMYVMESNGLITRIEEVNSDAPTVKTFENKFLAGNDLESFMYDSRRKKLIIGVKTPSDGGDERSFFAFNLDSMLLDQQPIFQLTKQAVQDFIQKKRKDASQYEYWTKEKRGMPSPSAIAVHPLTGNYYILASLGKTILVTTPEGGILEFIRLDKKLHTKPEGLAFAPDGTMYISNEADGDVARLYMYSPE